MTRFQECLDKLKKEYKRNLESTAATRATANKIDKEGNAKYDLLLYVANWPEKRIGHWEKLLSARAIENQAYVAGLNRVGVDGNGLNYNGQSVVNDYNGLPILSFEKNENAVRSTTLSATSLQVFRKELPFLNDF